MQINRYRGDTDSDSFMIANSRTGEVVDLTGCSFKLTVNTQRNPTDSSQVVYQLTGFVSDPLTGIVEFQPNSTQADNVGLFYYDVQMVDGNGIVRTLVKDVYVYEEDITKN